ncbi:MAG TPA: DUF692 domain-containing protein [Polyangiaceae bacterium]
MGLSGVGIGWRPELATDLLSHPRSVDLVEVTAEGCATPAARREACAIAEAWPVVVHGVKTSLGSAEGIDRDRAKKLAAIARDVRAPCVSEHVAFVRAGGVEIGHLTGMPFTRDAVAVLARNVAAARRLLPDVPLLLENVAWSFRWPEDALDEGDFHREVTEATGCDLLLDVGNLYANARNAGRDPDELLARYPLDRVAMIHVAGGVFEDGFYFDTHSHPVPEAVLDLVARALASTGDVPVVLERDGAFPPFEAIAGELSRLASSPRGPGREHATRTPLPAPERLSAPMAAEQHRMAVLLTAPDAPVDAVLARARDILQKKRADDALPLLPTVAAHGAAALALAVRTLEGTRRPPSMVAVSDALRIARAAEDDAALREAARSDASLLRARFIEDDGVVRPRVTPFVERRRVAGGVTRWVVKGPGAGAKVRIIERRGQP